MGDWPVREPWFLRGRRRVLIYAWLGTPDLARMIVMACLWGVPNMAILVPWGLPWWQAPPEEVTPE